MNVAFPLRDGYFPPLQATPEDRARWTRRVREHVQQTLVEERPFFASGYEDIDSRQWKLVRRKDQLRVFRPRRERSSRSAGSCMPSLLEIGTIEGTLEDVIYGVHNSSTHDMRVTTSFLSADALDSAVLEVFENGCEDDYYRSFTLKWRILETPAGSLVKNRDVLLLEYMGIARDSNGERFAFHICDSFDHPVCPPFNPQCVVRAKTHTRIIYRQVRPGRVGVYYRAENTSGGRIPMMLARWTLIEVAVSIGRSVECAEAKKLTTIALAAHATEESKQAVQRRGRGGSSVRSCLICDEPSHKTLRSCDVCSAHVCNRCRSRKYLLSDEGKVQIVCCKQCIVAAKTMVVDARKPLGIISASYWNNYGVIVSANAPPPESGAHREIFHGTASAAGHGRDARRTSTVDRQSTKSMHSYNFNTRLASGRRKTHEDVEEIMAAMSTTSASTVESMASRDDLLSYSIDSFDESPRVESKRKASAVAPVVPMDISTSTHRQARPAPANEAEGALWQQMKQLRVAAEQTYRMTKENSQNWVR